MFKIGDYVRLNRVTEDDILRSRYVGEQGVVRGYTEEGYVRVGFECCNNYFVNEEDLDFESEATIRSILLVYGLEEREDLFETLDEFFREHGK